MRNVRVDPRIDDESRRRYLLRGYEVLSLLLAPIHDSQGRVVGLVELVNKVELVGSGNGGDAPMAAPTPVAVATTTAAAAAAAAAAAMVGGKGGRITSCTRGPREADSLRWAKYHPGRNT